MLKIRRAFAADLMLYFDWVNDYIVRQNSINKSNVSLDEHTAWFNRKLFNPQTIMLVFLDNDIEIGQLRIEVDPNIGEAVINYSVSKDFRGKGYGSMILSESYKYFSGLKIPYPLTGFVKCSNLASISAFIKAGFNEDKGPIIIEGEEYRKFTKTD